MMMMPVANDDDFKNKNKTRNHQEKVTDCFLLFILFIICCRVMALPSGIGLGSDAGMSSIKNKCIKIVLAPLPFKSYAHEGGLSETSRVKSDFSMKDSKQFIWMADAPPVL